MAGAIAIWWRRTRPPARVQWGHLLALTGLGFGLVIAVQFTSAAGIPLLARLISPEYNGYFPTAVGITDVGAFLNDYASRIRPLGGRIGAHPPGNVLFFWLFYQLAQALPAGVLAATGPFLRVHSMAEWAAPYSDAQLTAAAMAGLAVVALAALTVMPLYYVGLETVGSARARQALILYLACPAISLFAPVVDLTYTLLAVTALWLGLTGFRRNSVRRLALSGAVLSIAICMSFSNLPLLFTVAVLGAALALNRPAPNRGLARRRLPLQFLALAAGSAFAWVLLWANPFAIFVEATAANRSGSLSRNYGAWLFYNPYDLLLFAGLPLALLFLIALMRLARRLRPGQALSLSEIVALAVAMGMAALFVSGVLRGETARTLLYYFPIMALVSQVNADEWRPDHLAVIAATTLVQTIVFNLGLRVYH